MPGPADVFRTLVATQRALFVRVQADNGCVATGGPCRGDHLLCDCWLALRDEVLEQYGDAEL